MKKRMLCKLTALLLAAVLIFAGCGVVDFGGYFRQLGNYFSGNGMTAFADMEYSRPDMEKMRSQIEAVQKAASDGSGVEKLMDQIYVFYEQYYDFYTNYLLANIYYSKDLTNEQWETEYDFCMDNSAWVDSALDQMYYDLADCPLREELEAEDFFGEGFFDDYDGESVWTDTFTSLMEQEAELISQYYALSGETVGKNYYTESFRTGTGKQMAELYVELVGLRQQIAKEAGYDSYPEFAYDFYHARDYTPEQATGYLADVQKELVPLYRQVQFPQGKTCTESETFDYVKQAASAMGGKVEEAFGVMEELGLYDIAYSENKYNASFECYLYSYYVPFVFMNPTGEEGDKLTFAHEFGHFCNDYASTGTQVGADVAEVFSQSMEYLSLCYGKNTQELTVRKMTDCLALFVEQSAYASFEQQVYGLTGADLTLENVYALYEQVGKDYGFDSWGFDYRDFVLITHYYTSPMYVEGYVFSNDAALQVYQMETAVKGTGLALVEQNLATQEVSFLGFVESAGLESPFTSGRAEKIRKTMESVLG